MKSYLIPVRDKKIRNGYVTRKHGLLCDKNVFYGTRNGVNILYNFLLFIHLDNHFHDLSDDY